MHWRGCAAGVNVIGIESDGTNVGGAKHVFLDSTPGPRPPSRRIGSWPECSALRGGPARAVAAGAAGGGVRRGQGTGPCGGQRRGGLLTSAVDAVRRRSRVDANGQARRRLSGQPERAEPPLDGMGLGHRAQDSARAGTARAHEDVDREHPV